MRGMRAEIAKMDDEITKLESHRKSHLDLRRLRLSGREALFSTPYGRMYLDFRQRATSTLVRDALKKDPERRKDEIRRLKQDIIHSGDIRSDAMVVTERYKKKQH
ncbi:hypothetical protein N7461_006184 [Penicillium sp. DV-2018c]|nr:hypothetical protein N7461_006184 [Penicillium sp. DV-2018c]